MKSCWQHRANREKLLVFCNGWGMDERPFLPLASRDLDVLHCYDFRQIDIDAVLPEIGAYRERVLLSWSMGVWGGQQIFGESSEQFDRTIAVNGTLCPVDDRFGIPRNLFAGTLEGWSQITRQKFYRRLCGNGEIERRFLQHQPARSLADQRQELAYYLDAADCGKREQSIYREVVVAEKDRIVPTANQLAFWGERATMLADSHFPFYRWHCWDDLLDGLRTVAR